MPRSVTAPPTVNRLGRAVVARLPVRSSRVARSLPIRAGSEVVEGCWSAKREAILDGIPARSATLRAGADQGEWGTTWTVEVQLDAPLPARVSRALAGKIVRRLKQLAETGEMATTAHNPAFREGTSGGSS